jgi:hypothetical protein
VEKPQGAVTADDVIRQFGAPVFTFVDQSHLAESGATGSRVDGVLTQVAVSYWHFDDPMVRVPRLSLWEAVRTVRDPQQSLAELTAKHLEHAIRSTGERPEDMTLERWMQWDPIPRVRDVRDISLIVNGKPVRAVTIEHPSFVGYGTVVGASSVTIVVPRDVLATVEVALTLRPLG